MDALTLGMYMIQIYSSTTSYSTWVLDTGCGSHIYHNMQMIKNSRRLVKDEVILCMENRAKVAALAIGIYILSLPTRLTLEISNYYYILNITKNIIFYSCLVIDRYSF